MHVFGRGLARLRVGNCDGVAVSAPVATLDGLVLERTRGTEKRIGVQVMSGHARLQSVAITGSFAVGLWVTGGDPFIVDCRYAA